MNPLQIPIDKLRKNSGGPMIVIPSPKTTGQPEVRPRGRPGLAGVVPCILPLWCHFRRGPANLDEINRPRIWRLMMRMIMIVLTSPKRGQPYPWRGPRLP